AADRIQRWSTLGNRRHALGGAGHSDYRARHRAPKLQSSSAAQRTSCPHGIRRARLESRNRIPRALGDGEKHSEWRGGMAGKSRAAPCALAFLGLAGRGKLSRFRSTMESGVQGVLARFVGNDLRSLAASDENGAAGTIASGEVGIESE